MVSLISPAKLLKYLDDIQEPQTLNAIVEHFYLLPLADAGSKAVEEINEILKQGIAEGIILECNGHFYTQASVDKITEELSNFEEELSSCSEISMISFSSCESEFETGIGEGDADSVAANAQQSKSEVNEPLDEKMEL